MIKVFREKLVQLAPRANKVHKEKPDPKVCKERKAIKVNQELQVQQVHKELKAHKGKPAQRVL